MTSAKRRRGGGSAGGVGVQILIDRAHGAAHLGLTRVRVRPGSRTETGLLRRREEAWLIIQGVGCFQRSAEDGTGMAATTLRHGDTVFVPPDYSHWIESIGEEDLVFLRCTSPPEPSPAMTPQKTQGEHIMADRYEYKILVSDSDDETDEETLNGLGDQGWELINAVADVRASEDNTDDGGDEDQNVPVTVFYFKRRKES